MFAEKNKLTTRIKRLRMPKRHPEFFPAETNKPEIPYPFFRELFFP
jgi:hypothetical protein